MTRTNGEPHQILWVFHLLTIISDGHQDEKTLLRDRVAELEGVIREVSVQRSTHYLLANVSYNR